MQNLQDMIFLTVLLWLIAGIIVYTVSRSRRARAEVCASLEREGYRVMRIENRSFRRGPFFWKANRSQLVFRFWVRDATGRELSGWALWGPKWVFGLHRGIEWKWD